MTFPLEGRQDQHLTSVAYSEERGGCGEKGRVWGKGEWLRRGVVEEKGGW